MMRCRSSSAEWPWSKYEMLSRSRKTLSASSNGTPCFSRFRRAFESLQRCSNIEPRIPRCSLNSEPDEVRLRMELHAEHLAHFRLDKLYQLNDFARRAAAAVDHRERVFGGEPHVAE